MNNKLMDISTDKNLTMSTKEMYKNIPPARAKIQVAPAEDSPARMPNASPK